MNYNFLILKCTELDDQWECEADRTPYKMVENLEDFFIDWDYDKDGLIEIYKLNEDGTFSIVMELDNCPYEIGKKETKKILEIDKGIRKIF